MSGKRIGSAERSYISQGRRAVRGVREAEFRTFGNNSLSVKTERAYNRIGR